MGAGLPGVAGQEGEDVELLGGEVDRRCPATWASWWTRSRSSGPTMIDVGGDSSAAERPVADGGADPGFELGHAEGLGHVVVGSAVEGGDLAVLGAAGRQDDDRHLAPLADPPAHRQSVDVGQAEVEHDDVGGGQGGLGDPLLAVDGGDDLVAAGLQARAGGPAGARGRRR